MYVSPQKKFSGRVSRYGTAVLCVKLQPEKILLYPPIIVNELEDSFLKRLAHFIYFS